MPELYVIATISNPLRYQSRYRLYEQFSKRLHDDGAMLYTIELAYAGGDFAVTDSGNSRHIQLRAESLIWHKENLVNIALKRLPPGWQYAAWVDADIAFVRPDWIAETLAQLERHAFVQLFTNVVDLGPNYEPLKTYEGFVHQYLRERAAGGQTSQAYGQTGYAWAGRRQAIESVGGLIDWSILGSNDYYMALALIGEVDPASTRVPASNYAKKFIAWQERCQLHVGRDIGCVDNTLVHYWHGRRKDRGYDTRWKVIADHRFDPDRDLRTDPQGLLELTDANPGLRDALRGYFADRNEDGEEV